MYVVHDKFLDFLIRKGFNFSPPSISKYGFHVKLREVGLNDGDIIILLLDFDAKITRKIEIPNAIETENLVSEKFVYENFREYITQQYFIIKHKKFGKIMIAYTIDAILNNKINLNKILYCPFAFYQNILCGLYSNNLTKSAIFSRNQKAENLYLNGSKVYYKAMFLIVCMTLMLIFWPLGFWLWYLANILLRVTQAIFSVTGYSKKIKFKEIDWPIYSILVPLYKEEKMIDQLIKSLINIDYPKHLLDIKILLEEDDKETIKALYEIALPYYITIIKVPVSIPRNKPKALNFGFSCIKGEYMTIYDAEDIPSPNQLKMAVLKFMQCPSSLVALQSPLNYYNKNYNLLTKLSALEYSVWFDFLLQGSKRFGGFIPLGGTSNHCKVKCVDQLQRWNAFNVTEDIELAAKMVQNHFEIDFLPNHTTMEEAVISLPAWIKQRTRWMKGYIVTLVDYFEEFNCGSTNIFNKINFNNFCFFVIINPLLMSFFILTCIIKYLFSIDIL